MLTNRRAIAGAIITPGGHVEWAEQIRALAALPNAVMKISGYLTAAEPKPLAAETLLGYAESAVGLFGAARLMFGSDYPICAQAGSYAQVVEMLGEAMRHLDVSEQAQIMGGTAERVYGL
jgi:L-fuconolactonase